MKLTIATAPCSWGVWYADGTPSGTPYPVFLDQAAASGYKALELGPSGYLPTDPGLLRHELESRGLTLCSGTSCHRLDQLQGFADLRPEIDALCRTLSQFGAKDLVAMDESDVGRFSEKKQTMPKELRMKYLGIVKELARFTQEAHGIRLVYHPHVKSLFEYEVEIEELMDVAGVDLCFDTGHHAYSNGGTESGDLSALNFLRKHSGRIPYLHFKNVDGAVRKKVIADNLDADQAFDINVMCDLEDGIIPFTQLKTILDEINFTGIAVIEQDMPRATTDEAFAAARRNLEYLRRISML